MASKVLYSGPTGTVSVALPDGINIAEKLTAEGGIDSKGEITSEGGIYSKGKITSENGFVGPGAVPVGAIIAIADTRAWGLPASGTINQGWAICDGQPFPEGSHPSLTGNRPNLRDDRFLQGSTTSGNTGGASTVTLTTSHLPKHSHGMVHKHSISHSHQTGGSGTHDGTTSSNTHNHPVEMFNVNRGATAPEKIPVLWNTATGNANSATGPYWWFDAGHIYYNWDDRPEVRLDTAYNTHWHYLYVNDFSGNSGNPSDSVTATGETGSGSAFDIRPKYFNVIYLIRVV